MTTTLRDEARRRASGDGHRQTSPQVAAARLSLLLRPPEPEVMRTSIDEANVAAVPAAAVRKQERARRRPRPASERRVLVQRYWTPGNDTFSVELGEAWQLKNR